MPNNQAHRPTLNENLKYMQCRTCPEILTVDRRAESCQCGPCAVTKVPVRRLFADEESEQLELVEAGS